MRLFVMAQLTTVDQSGFRPGDGDPQLDWRHYGMELKIENLTKQYANKTAINHVTCTLKPGITGLLGANGAGKSTLMRMICGVMKPTEGKITLGEYDVTDKNYRNILGYLPQDFGYYPDFTGMEFLLYVAALKGLDKETAKKRSQKLLEQVNLEKDAKRKIKTYSGGMKRRLGIAQVLLNEPRLIVLDEILAGTKTMVVRGAAGRKIPHSRFFAGGAHLFYGKRKRLHNSNRCGKRSPKFYETL